MVAESSSHSKAVLAFEGLQAFVILLVAGFGWHVAWDVTNAASYVNENMDQFPTDGVDTLGKDRWEAVHPGDMMLHIADDDGMASCQLHLNVNMHLKWGKDGIVDAEVLKANVDSGIKGDVKVGSLSIGDEKKACPIENSYIGDCTYLRADVWQTVPESQEERYFTLTMYAMTSLLMVVWMALKLISLDADLVDAVVGRVCCCCFAEGTLKGHTNAMNLRFSFLPGWLSFPLQKISVYLRFKIASNVMLWPLTTLGYNEKCPKHVFTQLPGLVFWYVLTATASMDLLYTMTLYVISAKRPTLKEFRWLRLPQVGSLLFALGGAVVVLMKSSWSVIFGFNYNIFMSFELAAHLGMFQAFFLLLTVLEMVSLGFKVAKCAVSLENQIETAVENKMGEGAEIGEADDQM